MLLLWWMSQVWHKQGQVELPGAVRSEGQSSQVLFAAKAFGKLVPGLLAL